MPTRRRGDEQSLPVGPGPVAAGGEDEPATAPREIVPVHEHPRDSHRPTAVGADRAQHQAVRLDRARSVGIDDEEEPPTVARPAQQLDRPPVVADDVVVAADAVELAAAAVRPHDDRPPAGRRAHGRAAPPVRRRQARRLRQASRPDALATRGEIHHVQRAAPLERDRPEAGLRLTRESGNGSEHVYDCAVATTGEERRETDSGIEIKPVYTADEAPDELELPGEFPFTRGPYKDMYRGRPWTIRQYAGFASAEETNQRFRYLLDRGQMGLSVAFDLPTQLGYDSDDPRALGEVGRTGVAIDSIADMELLFDAIPLGEVSTSMTLNAPAALLLLLYELVAEAQGA